MDERDSQILKLQAALEREARKSAELRAVILGLSKRLESAKKKSLKGVKNDTTSLPSMA